VVRRVLRFLAVADRSTDYDYDDLAAAMDDGEGEDDGGSGAEEEPDSGIHGSDSDAESLEGAQFSALSGSEGEEGGTGSDSEGESAGDSAGDSEGDSGGDSEGVCARLGVRLLLAATICRVAACGCQLGR